jgi:hypothetical protein
MPEMLSVPGDVPSPPLPIILHSVRILAKFRWWHLVALFLIATLYWLVPYNQVPQTREIEALGGPVLKAAEDTVSGKHGPPPSQPEMVASINPLVRGIITLVITWDNDGVTHASPQMTTELRADNLILMWGLCLGSIIALASARPERPGRTRSCRYGSCCKYRGSATQ